MQNIATLTGRSSGRQQGPWLHHCPGPCWCHSVAALLAAPLTLGAGQTTFNGKTMKKYIAIVTLCLTACAAPGTKFTSLPLPSDGNSTLYFMKTKSMTGLDTIFTLDGKPIGRIDKGQYSWTTVQPGTYVLRTEDEASPHLFKMKVNKLNIQIEIEPNKEYYIERLDESAEGRLDYQAILRAVPKSMAMNRISDLNISANQTSNTVSKAQKIIPTKKKIKQPFFYIDPAKNPPASILTSSSQSTAKKFAHLEVRCMHSNT